MLSWFRRQTRSIAGVALVALATLSVWSAAPHQDDCHDASCGVVTVHDPSGHRIGRTQGTSEQPLHCILCQWTRSMRTAAPAVTHLPTPVVTIDVRVSVDVFSAQSQYSAAQPPLRAPPSLG